ncbi:MAG: RNA polymerase sigma factor WhiG [Spirochaetota bacterium]|jgi:RNA polymerase sigma factor for flagellar operon FliA|nr:RNA polymerase sigma factor WhiG [Spirochaetota bacterium]
MQETQERQPGAIREKKRLEQLSEEELWPDYLKTRDPLIREVIAERYAPLVKYVAAKVASGLPQSIEFDDLIGYGAFGLIDAIEKYDPGRNTKFKTYAVTRIRGAIFDNLRDEDWVPRSVRQKIKDLESVINSMENRLGRTVEDTEIAEEMGVSIDEFHDLMRRINCTPMLSLNDTSHSSKDHERLSLTELLESPASLNPDSIVEREEIRRMVYDVIQALPEKEKKVLILYYYEDLTLKEIGQVLEVTESRVSQLHTKAIYRLRTKLERVRASLMT